jgi:hypothetical protein
MPDDPDQLPSGHMAHHEKGIRRGEHRDERVLAIVSWLINRY